MPVLPAKQLAILLAHGAVGWALCALVIGVGMAVTTMPSALFAHAVLGPLAFGGVALHYFRRFGYTSPGATAAGFLAVVVLLDFFIVALLIERSFAMFASLIGTWVPWVLIFAVTYAVGSWSPGR